MMTDYQLLRIGRTHLEEAAELEALCFPLTNMVKYAAFLPTSVSKKAFVIRSVTPIITRRLTSVEVYSNHKSTTAFFHRPVVRGILDVR